MDGLTLWLRLSSSSQACVSPTLHLRNSAASELSSGLQASAACPHFAGWVQSQGLQLWEGDTTRCWPGVSRRALPKRPEGDPGDCSQHLPQAEMPLLLPELEGTTGPIHLAGWIFGYPEISCQTVKQGADRMFVTAGTVLARLKVAG